ncbi:MAG: hypothetical protein ABL959_14930 [Pyrinomonadaceae bacterium]
MSNYKIVSGRVFRGVEVAIAERWLNEATASGWRFVATMPIVEDGHAMYVFERSGGTQLIETELSGIPEPIQDGA